MQEDQEKAVQREILLSLWKVHILIHAAESKVVGQWMIKELQSHGYSVSPGTLYPILHRMEKLGWLTSECEGEQEGACHPKARRLFTITELGREILNLALKQIREIRLEVE